MRVGTRRPVFVFVLSLMLLSLIMRSPSAATVNCIAGSTTDFGKCIDLMVPLALIGIMFSLSLIALAYMLGEVFNISNLKGWYRTELREAAKSALLIVIIVAALVILSSIAAILAGTPATTGTPTGIYSNLNGVYNDVYNNYLNPELAAATTAYNEMIYLAVGVGFVKSISISSWIPIPLIPPLIFAALQFGSTESLFRSSVIESTSASPQGSFIYDAITLLAVPIYLAMQVQIDILWSIIEIGMLVFIPIGILLRALPFLRGIGGTLVAIGIAVSLVYPATLVGLNMPITGYFNAIQPQAGSCSLSSSNFVIGAIIGIICSIITTTGNVLAGVGTAFASTVSVYPALNLINGYEFPLIVQFILLILDLVVIVTVASNIARMLGGGLRLGIGKMKLI